MAAEISAAVIGVVVVPSSGSGGDGSGVGIVRLKAEKNPSAARYSWKVRKTIGREVQLIGSTYLPWTLRSTYLGNLVWSELPPAGMIQLVAGGRGAAI